MMTRIRRNPDSKGANPAPARQFAWALAAVVALAVWQAPAAQGDTIEVGNRDNNGSGSLRWAMILAEDNFGPDTIVIQPTGTIQLRSPLPRIESTVTIAGPGADKLTINGDNEGRVLTVWDDADARISGVTISGGRRVAGGGVYNSGKLLLENVVVADNVAFGEEGFSGHGGGIYNKGELAIEGSTIRDNIARTVDDGRHAWGGGIANEVGGKLTLRRTTVARNRTLASITSTGGGIAMTTSATATIESSTIADNEVIVGDDEQGNGAAIDSIAESLTVQNTILAESEGASVCSGDHALTSMGHNLASDATCELTGDGDQQDIDPQLEGLDENGGPTRTIAIAPSSPARDQGSSGGLTEDQRGFARVHDDPAVENAQGGDGADIGAYEAQPFVVNSLEDPGDGSCTPEECTLHEAMDDADSGSGFDRIVFADDVTGTIELAEDLPELSSETTIEGPGADLLTVRAEGRFRNRVFTVRSSGKVAISGLEIANGSDVSGGGILNDRGELELNGVVVRGNLAGLGGGGIMNRDGLLTVTGSSILANDVMAAGLEFAPGGGIASEGEESRLILRNSTVSGNLAASELGVADGGGVFVSEGSDHLIENVTIAENQTSSSQDSGSLGLADAPITIRSTILTGADGVICSGDIGGLSSAGYNLARDSSCELGATGDRQGVDPELEPLALNGGTTPTHAFAVGSPAHDQGNSNGAELDQRGEPRIVDDPIVVNAEGGDGTDVGAFELAETTPASCAGEPATIIGTPGPDVLTGTPGRDVITGKGGDDEVRGLGGGDVTCGRAGDDRILGGGGADLIIGGKGEDVLRGGAGGDQLFGRRGDDDIFGGPGADLLSGGRGADRLRGGPSRDRCHGGRGASDSLRGCER